MQFLCTMTVDELNVSGVPRYPVGISPIIDSSTEVPVDIKKEIIYHRYVCASYKEFVVMGYLPAELAKEGQKLAEYFNEDGDGIYPITVKIVSEVACMIRK